MTSRWWLPVLDGPELAAPQRAYEIVVVGCSLGGMHALEVLLNGMPRAFPLPIAVVQHRHRASNETLPSYFRRFSRLPVVDAEDKQWLRPGTVYLAPANYHLLVERGELNLSVDEKVRYSRPSVDVLFQSAADAYGAHVIAVVLTGANDDGAQGVKRVKARGGLVVVQDPETAEASEMPRAAIAAAAVDQVLPLDRIASYLVDRCVVASPA
ncbi:MAG TPA: chemotaxis protein CheB [Thermoanaerobaculia bacterium]|jgi:two-component system chemotaxis response regulator CheB